jgi:TonB-linked SusC/RagA family outer membrane protein
MNIKLLHKFSGALLLMMLWCTFIYAQDRKVTGKVVDQTDGSPLPGVNVSIKGRPSNVSTDANGAFIIQVPAGAEQVLVFTYIGYTRQQISVVGKSTLNVSLAAANNNLNEVVVVGYGEQKKITMTGAVSTIDVKKIEDLPNLSLSASLAGQVPGLSVNTVSQRPGQPSSLTIRNPVSLNPNGRTGTAPLYVIDDQIRSLSDFNLLDPNEIENLSILKDAEAAIYGIQGANGVVLVRTKRGKSGAPKISFSSSVGSASARQLPKMLSGYQLGTFLNDYYQTRAGQGLNTTAGSPTIGTPNFIDVNGYLNGNVNQKQPFWYTPDELAYFQENNNNYLKQAFQTAYTEREAINVSGGSDKVTYFIGGNYVNQGSNFKGVNSNKWGLRASVEAKPAKGLTASLNLNSEISYSRSFWYKYDSTTESLDNDATALNIVQPWQKYFIDGNPVVLNGSLSSGGGLDNINVFLFQNSNNYTQSKGTVLNALMKVTYEIPGVKGLSTSVSLNENYNNSWGQQYGTSFNMYTYSGLGNNNHIPGGSIANITLRKNGDRIYINPIASQNYQLDATLNYNRTFGKHTISFLGVYEQREQTTTGVRAQADGVIIGGKDNQNFTTGVTSSNQASSLSNDGYISYIGRVNYSYADKYLFQISTRVDGTTDFLPGKNYGYFPSASIGWVASNESFIKNNYTWIDLLKFRASVGLLGSSNVTRYQYAESYKFGTGSGGGAVFNEAGRGYGIQYNLAMANPNVTWDHTTKTEYGLDLAFLKSRLNFSADYFWNHGYDLITGVTSSVPSTVAATLPLQNFGIVNTFGYEISAGWRDHLGKNFSYNFSPFFSWSDNKQIRVDQSVGLIGTVQDAINNSSDMGSYGWKSLGIIRTKEQADAIIAERSAAAGGDQKVTIQTGNSAIPIKDANGIYHLGMLNYRDMNGDGIIDIKDEIYLNKKTSNHYNLGLNFGGSFKSLTLGVVMGMSWGGQGSLGGYDRLQTSSSNPITENKPVYWADHWTSSNPNAKHPNPYYTDNFSATSDFWFISSFSWNITSMNLSYTLPTKWTSKIGMSSARIYAVGYNLFSLVNNYPGHFRDPQTSINQYPAIRTASLGLNVGF